MDKLEKKMNKMEEEQGVKVCLLSLYWNNEMKRSSSPLEDLAPEERFRQLSGDQVRLEQCEEGRGRH